jgi:hypothetical protein
MVVVFVIAELLIFSPDVVVRPTALTEPLAVMPPDAMVTLVPSPPPMVADVAPREPRMVVLLVCRGPAMTAPPDVAMLLVKKVFVESDDAVSVEVWIVEEAMSLASRRDCESIWTSAMAGYNAQSATFDRSPACARSVLLKYRLDPMACKTCAPDASISVICPVRLGKLYQLLAPALAGA